MKIPDRFHITVLYESPAEERESRKSLRKWRDRLGYGPGWTFREAFQQWILPKLVILLGIFLFLIWIWIRSWL